MWRLLPRGTYNCFSAAAFICRDISAVAAAATVRNDHRRPAAPSGDGERAYRPRSGSRASERRPPLGSAVLAA